MDKQKKNLGIKIILILSVCLLPYILIAGFILWALIGETKTTNDISAYTGRVCMPQYDGRGTFGYCLGFPENIENIEIDSFSSTICTGLTYQECEIYLVYHAEEEEYQKEKDRIGNLVLANNELQRSPVYITEGMQYPGYILSIDFDCSEYVMFNDDEQEIICVYLQLDDLTDNNLPQEYNIDKSALPKEIREGYSIYFDDEKNRLTEKEEAVR